MTFGIGGSGGSLRTAKEARGGNCAPAWRRAPARAWKGDQRGVSSAVVCPLSAPRSDEALRSDISPTGSRAQCAEVRPVGDGISRCHIVRAGRCGWLR